MAEQFMVPVPAGARDGSPLLFIVVRNTKSLRHNWRHEAFGEYGSEEECTARYLIPPATSGGIFWELAVELRQDSPTGPLANGRIVRATFELPDGLDTPTTPATVPPFRVANRASTPFTACIHLSMNDSNGNPRPVELAHRVDMDGPAVAAMVYQVSEEALALGDPSAISEGEATSDFAPKGDTAPQPLCGAFRQLDGATIDECDIVENMGEVGRGASGIVFKARTKKGRGLPQFVAIKQQMLSSVDDQFLLEAKAASKLPPHENVAALLGWGVIFGKPSLVFEFFEAGDLHAFLKASTDAQTKIQTVSPAAILDLSVQIAAGMAHLHKNRLYHRDLKPNNVMLTRRGVVGPSGLRAVVTDLGLAKSLGSQAALSQSVQGSQVGTYCYMAPETIAKSVFSQGTDVWSYAAIVWQLLVGQAPYTYLGSFNAVAVAFQVGFGNLAPKQLAWPAPFDNLLSLAFSRDHHERPTFTDIHALLSSGRGQFATTDANAFRVVQQQWAAQLIGEFGSPRSGAGHSASDAERLSPPGSSTALGESLGSPASDASPLDGFASGAPTFVTGSSTSGHIRSVTNPRSPLAIAVSGVVGAEYDQLLDQNGFSGLDDFEMYTEVDLVEMGFKKVHARKLIRAVVTQ